MESTPGKLVYAFAMSKTTILAFPPCRRASFL